MNIKQLSLVASISALTFSTATNAVLGPIPIYLNPVKIESNYFNDLDTKATFASEIYTAEDLKNSGSTNLYEFLSNNTSIAITPSSGNRFSQKIDMRGYGTTNGHKNLVITLNGVRLNNHTSSPQSIGNISINNIDRIEITKGSGSVVYGDGAMSGAIHIFTKNIDETIFKYSNGNYGVKNTLISTGSVSEIFKASISAQKQEQGGYSEADNTGNRDWGEQNNKKFSVETNVTPSIKLLFTLADSDSDYRYPESMSIDKFNIEPEQNGTKDQAGKGIYAHSVVESRNTILGINTKINKELSVNFKTTKEKKDAETTFYWGSSGIKKDKKTSDTLTFKYEKNSIIIDSGYSKLYGEREEKSSGSNTFDKLTTKDNKGYFIQGKYLLDDTTYTAGYRDENVDYFYNKTLASGHYDLTALNIGFNKKLDDNLSVFSNYNEAFQAYDINTAFKYTGSPTFDNIFDSFIKPMTGKTINIGLNYIDENNKTKLTLFRSNLNNEIYLHKQNKNDLGTNSNLDKSHKTGLEMDTKFFISPKITTRINYAYIDSIIDSEDANEDRGSFNGKTLPGVSKHTIATNVKLKITDKSTLILKHKYRSKAYAEEDFSNTNASKTQAFNSTDINYLYKHSNNLEFALDVENLFRRKHATLLGDYNTTDANVVYPANFTSNIKAGLTYRF